MNTTMHLYVIYDRVAEESSPIFEAINDGVAVRSCRAMPQFTKPELRGEFQLLHVGLVHREPLKIDTGGEYYAIDVHGGEVSRESI